MKVIKNNIIRKFGAKTSNIINSAVIFCAGILFNYRFVFASTGNEKMDNSLTALKTLFTGIVSMIGAVVLIKNIMDFANAFQQRDQAAMTDGLRGIVAGLLMTFVGGILTLLGIK